MQFLDSISDLNQNLDGGYSGNMYFQQIPSDHPGTREGVKKNLPLSAETKKL